MGMFDSFILEVKCPFCGNVAEVEFQTKDFDCRLDVWKQGDRFITENSDIDISEGTIKNVYGSCLVKNNPNCGEMWERKNHPNSRGFGRPIMCDVLIKDGIVVKAINVREWKD